MTAKNKKDRIGQILDALKKAADGDYSGKIDSASQTDDLDPIAEAINGLLSKTDKRIKSLTQYISDLAADAGRYRNIIESIEESYFEVDLKGHLQFFNARVMLDLGYSEEDLIGMHFHHLADPANAQKLYDAFHKVFVTGQPIKSLDWEILKKDKEKIDVEASISLRCDETGRPVGFRGVVRDVSSRKKAEEAIYQSEERYRTILDITEEGYIENDLSGRITFANETACRLMGHERKRLIGMHYREYLSATVAEHMHDVFQRVYITSKPELLVDYDLVRPDGTIKSYQMNVALRYDALGNACGFGVLTRDLSQYKETREALQKSEEKYRNILENMAETYLETDTKGNFLFFNDSLCRVLGYTREELQGASYKIISPPGNRKLIFDAFSEIYRTGKAKTFNDHELLAKDGSIVYLDMSIALMRSPEGKPLGFSGLGRDVTEKVKAQRKNEESARHLRLITDNIADIIWTMDFNLNWTYLSPSVLQLTGFTPEEVMHIPLKAILPPDIFGQVGLMVQEEISKEVSGNIPAEKRLRTFEMPLLRKEGSYVWIEISATFNRDESGKPFEIVGVTRNITERKKVQNALLESEKRYRMIAENVNDIVWTIGMDLRFIYVSPSSTRVTGYTPEEAMASPLNELLTPESFTYATQRLAEELALLDHKTVPPGQINPIMLEVEAIHKDGTTFWLEVTGTFNRNSEGTITEILAVGRNITERKKVQNALHKSEKRYRMIMENMHEIIWTTDLNMRNTYMSPSCFHLTGYTPEELLLLPPDQVITPESMILAATAVSEELTLEFGGQPLDHHRSKTIEQEILCKNGGTLWLEVTATFIRDEEGKPTGMLMAGRDITLRKKAEQEKQKLEGHLLQAQKMETVGRLAGGVAHDFNNMLSVILGYVDLAKLRLAKQHPVLKDIAEIEKAAVRSRDITTQLLAFSRKQVIEPKIIDLNDLVSHTDKALMRLIGEDIELKVLTEKNLWAILFDPSQIEQILINLAVNARDAMPDGGKLTIETSNLVLDEFYCRNHIDARPGSYVRLTVSDNGTGMNKDTLEHIFEPFFSTKEVGKGTGLGLATVYGIVKQNNGFLNVYSEPGNGTTFSIYLPRTTEAKETQDASEDELPLTGAGNILLVEDDAMVLQITKGMLESIGYSVKAVDAPGEALSLFEKAGSLFDLVITDVVMPSMSGKELRNKLLEIQPETKVLFMSGYTADVIAHHGVLEEGVHFLQKPFTIRSLAGKVSDVMAKSP